jgi:site-specific recombinase XerD
MTGQELILTGNGVMDQVDREIARDPRLKSENTRRGYHADLAAFEAWRAGRPMGKLLVEQYAAELQQSGRAPRSINRALAAVRWWARRVVDLAYESGMPAEQRAVILDQAGRVAAVKDVTGTRPQKGRHIATGELGALMDACAADPTPAGIRDAAIIALAWATGARRSELAGLTLADFSPTGEGEGDLLIRDGKGDKARTVFVFNGSFEALADWLTMRGSKPGPLFYAIRKGGHVTPGAGVSDEALAQMLDKRAKQAGLSKPVTWHDFRRSFAGNLLDNGNDLVTVQKLMGHSSPITTSNYDRRGEETKRRASRTLHVPYRRRRLME